MHRCNDGVYREGDARCACARNRIAELEEIIERAGEENDRLEAQLRELNEVASKLTEQRDAAREAEADLEERLDNALRWRDEMTSRCRQWREQAEKNRQIADGLLEEKLALEEQLQQQGDDEWDRAFAEWKRDYAAFKATEALQNDGSSVDANTGGYVMEGHVYDEFVAHVREFCDTSEEPVADDDKPWHFDKGKPVLPSTMTPNAILEVGRVFAYGRQKYVDVEVDGQPVPNWYYYARRTPITDYLASAERHLNAYLRGENDDPETGLSHLAHAVANCLMILEAEELYIESRRGVAL